MTLSKPPSSRVNSGMGLHIAITDTDALAFGFCCTSESIPKPPSEKPGSQTTAALRDVLEEDGLVILTLDEGVPILSLSLLAITGACRCTRRRGGSSGCCVELTRVGGRFVELLVEVHWKAT